MKPYSPLRYPGGKAFLTAEFQRIIDKIGLKKPVYIEPYAGGAGAALALLFADKVKKIVINDYDIAIYSFWKSVIDHTEAFAEKILSTPVTVAEWKRQKKIYSSKRSGTFKRGFAAFFLNRTNRSGVMNASPIGGMDQSGNYKINARYNEKALAERVRQIGKIASRIEVYREEGMKLTKKYLNQSNTFIYLDPPYFKQGSMLYLRHYEEEDHTELATLLNGNAEKHWLLTYDERAKVRELYLARPRRRLPLHYRVRDSRRARELMIFSDTTSV